MNEEKEEVNEFSKAIIRKLINKIEKKDVKERTNEEHQFLIQEKYNGNVRDYLLSMGEFKGERFKTIEDLKRPDEFGSYVLIEELKKEAKKWLIRNFNEDWSDNDLNYVDWIDFFNIDVDKLKEEKE